MHTKLMLGNLTIVSAFICDINKSPDKTLEKYVKYGQQLMKINIPKVLFIDEALIDKLSAYINEYNTVIPCKLTDIYLYTYRDKLKNVKVNSTNPTKDTIEYFMVQCNKTEWIRRAIELDTYKSNQYMWIDFGIYQFIDKLNCSDEEKFKKFSDSLYQIEYQKPSLVRIPSIWNIDVNNQCSRSRLKVDVTWYFAGSLFGGDKSSLIKFADLMKSECLRMINNESWLVWEVNIWYLVYLSCPELFKVYHANHDLSIFENYSHS
jgi:hypothetical protein